MNLDDDLSALLAGADSSEPDFPLPSQRKKATRARGGGNRRRPATKPLMSLDKLLNTSASSTDPVFAGIALNGPDESPLSPPVIASAKPQERGPAPAADRATALDRLDQSLTGFIARAVDRVRSSFLDELKFMLDKTSDEDSTISAFLLSLPAEMEEAIASEIALARAMVNQERDAERVADAIHAQLEPLYRVVPQRGRKGEARPTLRGLSATVIAEQEELARSMDALIDELRAERSGQIELPVALGDGSEADARRCQGMEIAAAARRLDIERQMVDGKRKRLEEMKRESREAQIALEKEMEDPAGALLKKFAAVADQIPKSRLNLAIEGLKELAEAAKKNCEDMRNARSQLEVESETIAAACQQIAANRKRKERRVVQEDRPKGNVLVEAKRELEHIERKRRMARRK
jgi:hypothetical protein